MMYIFHRAEGWYPLELGSDAEAVIQKESAKFCKVSNIDQRDFAICAAAIRMPPTGTEKDKL